jgi:hypothetical protein
VGQTAHKQTPNTPGVGRLFMGGNVPFPGKYGLSADKWVIHP